MSYRLACRCSFLISIIVIGIVAVSCVDDEPLDCCGRPPGNRLAVVTAASDFSAANFELVSMDHHTVSGNLIPGLHTDHAVRALGSDVYILERLGKDNVIKYDTRDMVVEYQENIGAGLNIQDIAFASGTKAYISAYNSGGLIIFNRHTGKKTGTIDLSMYNTFVGTDSAEASPFASALETYGNDLYVACQRLKTVQEVWGTNIVAGDTSIIVIINTAIDAVVGSITLGKKNPASMSIYGGQMLVSSTGDWYDASSGGVELIDLSSNTNMGVVADGSAFGGSVSTVIFVSPNKAYISVGKNSEDFSSYWTEIVPFNPATGAVGAAVAGIGDGFGGLAFDGDVVYVGDRSQSAVAIINPATDTVERMIPTGMPPSSLAVFNN